MFGEEIQTQDFNIWNINEVIYKLINIYFSISQWTSWSQRKIRFPEHRVKLERWQGPPHINEVKQYETVLSFHVSLFIQSCKQR